MRTPTLMLVAALAASAAVRDFDVVVYGGTAGGVIAAVAATREGMKTALLEPGAHLGGMVSGGLGWTDYGKKEVIGGYALEFYYRVGRHYQMPLYGQDVAWLPEPHVAEEIFRAMVREAGVALFERERLMEKNGVHKQGARVTAIATEAGDQFTAKIFIDSTYEGDLMAQAGVSYTFGREAAGAVRRVAGGRARANAVPSVSGEYLRAMTRRASCCRRFRRARRRRRDRPTKPCKPTTTACASPTRRRTAWPSPGRRDTMRGATSFWRG